MSWCTVARMAEELTVRPRSCVNRTLHCVVSRSMTGSTNWRSELATLPGGALTLRSIQVRLPPRPCKSCVQLLSPQKALVRSARASS